MTVVHIVYHLRDLLDGELLSIAEAATNDLRRWIYLTSSPPPWLHISYLLAPQSQESAIVARVYAWRGESLADLASADLERQANALLSGRLAELAARRRRRSIAGQRAAAARWGRK